MKQWRDANPNDEAVQMFSAELALNLGRYREAADSLSALSLDYPLDRKLTVQSLERSAWLTTGDVRPESGF